MFVPCLNIAPGDRILILFPVGMLSQGKGYLFAVGMLSQGKGYLFAVGILS